MRSNLQEGTAVADIPAEELEDFFLLLPRIFCDYRDPNRGPFKLLYLFSETPDNEDSVFLKAVQMANEGCAEMLGVCDGELDHGYKGFDHSFKKLKDLGLKEGVRIQKLEVGGNVNTLSEARALATFVWGQNGDTGIIAPAFHLVRAFMTTVTVLNTASVRVYPIPGSPLPWNSRAVHSQGKLYNTREGLLGDELERLIKYREEQFGRMFTPSQVLKYLHWRGS